MGPVPLSSMSQRSLRKTQLQHALQTATFELNYERSARIVENVCRDEESRKLSLQLALLENENEELHNQRKNRIVEMDCSASWTMQLCVRKTWMQKSYATQMSSE